MLQNKERTMGNNEELKAGLIAEIKQKVKDRILEENNADLLEKLINRADNINEAMAIAELGTMYEKTGLKFDVRLEKMSNDIKYFQKNEKLSFHQDDTKPTHKLIIGDNYDALQNLLIEYKGKIDVIYIDPPYGKDSMGEFASTNYKNNITRDNLLSMLYPRLQLAKQLLSSEGVIFCSIDDKNQAYVKCLFDKVFGERNFVGNFIRKTVSQRAMAKYFNNQHDYCLLYTKDKDLFDLVGAEKDFTSYSNPDNDVNGEWKSSDPTMKGSSNTFEIKNPFTNKVDISPIGRGWAFNYETFKQHLQAGRIIFKKEYGQNERGFIYKSYKKDKSLFNLINSLEYCNNDYLNQISSKETISIFNKIPFDYAKPMSFVKSLINHNKNSSATILDFFAGSGTTGHAVLEMNKEDNGNRTFILCQMEEKTNIATEVTAERLKRIMTGEGYKGEKDFKWLENNKPYKENLDVYNIQSVANFEQTEGKTAFDVIDEELYGQEKFSTVKEKVEWVTNNFANTQMNLESEEDWQERQKGEK